MVFSLTMSRSATATGIHQLKRKPSYSLRPLLLSSAMQSNAGMATQIEGDRLAFRANLRPQLAVWLVG